MEQGPALSLSPSLNSYSFSKLSIDIGGDDRTPSDRISPVDQPEHASVDQPPPSDPRDNEKSDDDDDLDFTFVCRDADGSPISADEIFSNGQIRPVFPVFNRDLLLSGAGESEPSEKPKSRRLPLRKLMFEDGDSLCSSSSSESDELERIPEGTYCVWKPRSDPRTPKSNSTGSSKRWRFRDLLSRSSSEGKETFVFLKPAETPTERRNSGVGERKGKGKDLKQGDRRRTFLPYKKELMGIFSNG